MTAPLAESGAPGPLTTMTGAVAARQSSVSVIVVTWNGRALLRQCLSAVLAQTRAALNIVVVDNGSTDGTREMLHQDFPSVRLIANDHNVGFAQANVQALPACHGDYIALLNNDTAAHPDWLACLVDALERDPCAAGAGGTIVALDAPGRVIFTTPKIDPRSGGARWVNQAAPRCAVDSLPGNSMLMRRSVVEQIGFLDPAYEAYYEETDWCARALRAGYRLLYVPEAVIAHREQGTASGGYHARLMARNHLRFVLKQADSHRLPRVLARAMLEISLAAVREARSGQLKALSFPVSAILWNLVHLPATLRTRRLETRRLGPLAGSYLDRLPLRGHASDAAGGLHPPIGPSHPTSSLGGGR